MHSANFLNNIVEKINDRLDGEWYWEELVQYGSRQLRFLQSGQVGGYVLMMVIGMVMLFLCSCF